jgi:hypothetical protein
MIERKCLTCMMLKSTQLIGLTIKNLYSLIVKYIYFIKYKR